jgi:hypothetical protein
MRDRWWEGVRPDGTGDGGGLVVRAEHCGSPKAGPDPDADRTLGRIRPAVAPGARRSG